jgi:ribosomal RNA assembly protein
VEILARIPKDRIAVLIGKRGATRKMLEEASGAGIVVDSESGDVMADGASRKLTLFCS